MQTTNGKPRQRVTPPGVTPVSINDHNLFAPAATDDHPLVPRLSEAAMAIISVSPAPIDIEEQDVRQLACSQSESTRSTVVRYAVARFGSDQLRANKIRTARAVLKALKPFLAQVVRSREQHLKLFHSIPAECHVPPDGRAKPLALINQLVALSSWCLLFVGFVVSEFNNAVSLIEMSGLEFANGRFGTICFAAIYVIAPLVIFKYVYAAMPVAGKKKFDALVRYLGVPAALFGVLLFAWTIGGMQGDINAFSKHEDESVPFWILTASEMLLLAFCVMLVPQLISSSLLNIAPESGRRRLRRVKLELNECDRARAELLALEQRMYGLLAALKHERRHYVSASLAMFEKARNELLVKQAKARV